MAGTRRATAGERLFHQRLRALIMEGMAVVERLGEDPADPMIFRDATGHLLAVLVDPEGSIWSFSERYGLMIEES